MALLVEHFIPLAKLITTIIIMVTVPLEVILGLKFVKYQMLQRDLERDGGRKVTTPTPPQAAFGAQRGMFRWGGSIRCSALVCAFGAACIVPFMLILFEKKLSKTTGKVALLGRGEKNRAIITER